MRHRFPRRLPFPPIGRPDALALGLAFLMTARHHGQSDDEFRPVTLENVPAVDLPIPQPEGDDDDTGIDERHEQGQRVGNGFPR